MSSMEKDRPEYVQRLETQIKHLQAEHDRFKTLADLWEPKLTVVSEATTDKIQFGLEFGGKMTHASVSNSYLRFADSVSATTAIVNALVESLVVEKLRAIVQPQVERVIQNALSTASAGKW